MDLLKELKEANAKRCKDFGHQLTDWTLTDWGCAVAGETGELCNIIKKIHRGKGGNNSIENSVENLAREAADIVVYLDLLCQRAGIDLSDSIVMKFNEVSDRIGSNIKIRQEQDRQRKELRLIISEPLVEFLEQAFYPGSKMLSKRINIQTLIRHYLKEHPTHRTFINKFSMLTRIKAFAEYAGYEYNPEQNGGRIRDGSTNEEYFVLADNNPERPIAQNWTDHPL